MSVQPEDALAADGRAPAKPAHPRAAQPTAPPGRSVVLQRGSHASLIDGLILSGGSATWIAPEYDPELGMAHGVTPEALEGASARTPDTRAAFIVSPTYCGMAADVQACAEVANQADAALIVDNAWGPHSGFSPVSSPSVRSRSGPTRCWPPPARSSAGSPNPQVVVE